MYNEFQVRDGIPLCRRVLRLRRLWGAATLQSCRVNLVAHRIDVFVYISIFYSSGLFYHILVNITIRQRNYFSRQMDGIECSRK